jgi:hypothetical protein
VKRIVFLLVAVAAVATVVVSSAPVSGHADEAASPIYGVTIPPGYRDWKMIAVAQLKTDKVDQLRAQLGNEIAIKAYKEGKVPFPDGSIIVALHWNRVPSEDNNKVLAGPFPGAQSFVVGSPVNMQVMVKDSRKYAATGGWGFGDFKDANLPARRCIKPASPATNLPKIGTLSLPITHLSDVRSADYSAECPTSGLPTTHWNLEAVLSHSMSEFLKSAIENRLHSL